MDVIFICARRRVREGWAESAAFDGSLSIGGPWRQFEDKSMRWSLALPAIALTALAFACAARADDKQVEKLFFDTCLVNEASWIGKDQKSVAANCACKAKTEVKLADPAFKNAVARKQPYDKFPFGDPADYQRQVLQNCPALRPLMIQAMCNDPAAPPDACAAVKDMVSKLK
jgi:hypothetical protein